VPRIRDDYLDCAVYLYDNEVDAEDGGRSGGSGFLVGVPSEGLRQNFWFLYAVSDKHVIDKSRVLRRLNTSDGKKTFMPTVRSSWIYHPAGDDLSACQISFDLKDYKFNHVPRSSLLPIETIKNFDIEQRRGSCVHDARQFYR
jgi:hypothetical protein